MTQKTIEEIRNSDRYVKWREEVFKRDNYECTECGSKKEIQAHHIKRVWNCLKDNQYDLIFDVDNGETLCKDCHQKRHPDIDF